MFYKAFSVHMDYSVFSNGREIYTGGTWGLLNSLLTLKRNYSPKEIIICWDKGYARRTALYPEYKANRDKSDVEFYENFYAQMDMAKEVLQFLGVKQASKVGEEADDIVGTLSRKYRDQGMNVLMMSADKDYQQLIYDRIDLLAHKGKDNIKVWNDTNWAEMNGFYPSLFSMALGLMGDTGDNIPGVTGIGEKGAYKLICEEMDFLLAIIKKTPKPERFIKGKQNAAIKKLLLLENQKLFRLSYELAVIDLDVQDIEIVAEPKDMGKLGDLFEMYQFHSMLKKQNWSILEEL